MFKKLALILVPIVCIGILYIFVHKTKDKEIDYIGTWVTANKLNTLNIKQGKLNNQLSIQMINATDSKKTVTAKTDFIDIYKSGIKLMYNKDDLNPKCPVVGKIRFSKETIDVHIEDRNGSSGFGIFPGDYTYFKNN